MKNDEYTIQEKLDATHKQVESQKDTWLSWADKREALEKDASRYRLLRGASMDERNRFDHYAGTALDIVLDAAIKEQT